MYKHFNVVVVYVTPPISPRHSYIESQSYVNDLIVVKPTKLSFLCDSQVTCLLKDETAKLLGINLHLGIVMDDKIKEFLKDKKYPKRAAIIFDILSKNLQSRVGLI